jgi:hypothetical protein
VAWLNQRAHSECLVLDFIGGRVSPVDLRDCLVISVFDEETRGKTAEVPEHKATGLIPAFPGEVPGCRVSYLPCSPLTAGGFVVEIGTQLPFTRMTSIPSILPFVSLVTVYPRSSPEYVFKGIPGSGNVSGGCCLT